MKNKNNLLILFIIAGLLTTSSCRKVFYNCIRGNSDMQTELRYTNSFNGISSEGSFDVVVRYDTISSVEIKAESNLLPYIITNTINGILHIEVDDNRCLRENYPIVIYIRNPELVEVKLLGSGNIDCPDVITDDFYAEVSGSGEINLDIICTNLEANISGSGEIKMAGTAHQTDLTITGSGNISALNLIQNYCTIDIAGSGDMFLNVDKNISGQITGSGNVFYKGSPLVDVSVTGTGEIRPY